MKELDFDELDRAVNSLMGSAPKITSPAEPLEIKSTLPAELSGFSGTALAEPAEVKNTLAAAPQPTIRPSQTPQGTTNLVTPRRSGRFMDMVNTPASVKARPQTTTISSREGLLITPRSEADNPFPEVIATYESPEIPPASSSDMPDPLDVTLPNGNEADDNEASSALTVATGAGESPFLADAKVDKRPLNSAVNSDPEPLHETLDDSVLTTVSVDPYAKTEDEPPETPKVPELDTDLVAIESGESQEHKKVTHAIGSDSAETETASPMQTLGATSIAQQYTAQPSSGDKSHAAIYDSAQYPEPVAHPAKKKSGWLWVLWVILLLGIGAGGAVIMYSLGIIP